MTKEPPFLKECTSLRSHFAYKNIDLEEATGIDGVSWETFQIVLLNDVSRLSLWRKSRQVAWSWTVSCEAWIEACLYGTSSIFVSISKDEAKEKIRYARSIYYATKVPWKPKLTQDNEFTLGFSNGTFIESLPSRPPRGKAKRNVYLDEFAHVAKDRDIYKGALPIISKGGKVRIGSSTMGARGLFWEIDTESMQEYKGYRRYYVPWWEVRAFCKDIPKAKRKAPGMLTPERVELFGTDILKLIFENIVEEDFRQEYEGEYVDEVASWITWEEIKRNQDPELTCLLGEFKARNLGDAFALIEKARRLQLEGKIEWSMGAGVDIGRTRNTTEIYVGGENIAGTYPLRLAITLDGVEFEDQQAVIEACMDSLPIHTLYIDRNGLGMNLAENLEKKYSGKAKGFDFTNATKKVLASDIKMHMQKKRVPIPIDKDLAYQVHSIRRKVLSSGVFQFDVEGSEKHHADKFWSLALMLHALAGKRGQAGNVNILTIQ